MTFAFLRVKRGGNWDNIEVEHLTDKERRELFKDRDKEELLSWFDLVCNKLAEVDNILQREKAND